MDKLKKSHRFLIILVVLSILFPLTTGIAMAQGLPHVVLGVVTYNGTPVEGVTVEVSNSMGSWSYTTDAEGKYGVGISTSGSATVIDVITVNATYNSQTVSITADPTASATTINVDITGPSLDSDSNLLLIGSFLVVIIVTALVIIILMRRKK